jgi:hypothetical protein
MTTERVAMVVSGIALLVACGDGDRASRSQSSLAADVAGGETSEFSGGNIAYCPEAGATLTELDVESDELAPWVALAAGHHEARLRWTAAFVSDAIGGYEPQTSVALDVTVLGARDVVFGGNDLGYEGSGCAGQRERQFLLGVALRTSDGALSGQFEHWVSPAVDEKVPGGRYLSSTSKADNWDYPLAGFESALELDVQPEGELGRELRFQLSFDAESARGRIAAYITSREPSSETGRSFWSPLGGVFPDNGCESGWPAALDAEDPALGEAPIDAYAGFRAALERAPVPAVWQRNVRVVPSDDIETHSTEVSLRAGEPTLACRDAQGVVVHAPFSLDTADGQIHYRANLVTRLTREGIESQHEYAPLVPVADFEAVTGVSGVEFGAVEYAGVGVGIQSDAAGDEIRGTLGVSKWEGFETRSLEQSLEWCAGQGCEPSY